MTILPGLTSTKKERIPAFLADMERLGVSEIAFFPTMLSPGERAALYPELERVAGLHIPHAHIRSDFTEGELGYLVDRFGTEAFNIHPRASTHPFTELPARFAGMTFVENVDIVPEESELRESGGLCPDYSHWENARLCGREKQAAAMEDFSRRFRIGCCHLSAIRTDCPNRWSGEWDHHEFSGHGDLSFLSRYRDRMPEKWASLELENPLGEQLAVRDYLEALLA